MSLKHHFAAICMVTMIAGCSTTRNTNWPTPSDFVPLAEIQIQDRFQTTELTLSNLDSEIRDCLKSDKVTSNPAEIMPSARSISQTRFRNTSNEFYHTRTIGMCLKHSEAKYPILAGEVFEKTANPTNIPSHITSAWHRQMALELAKTGEVTTVYSLSNGNAYIVKYWVNMFNTKDTSDIKYSYEFKKNGEWIPTKYRLIFSHPNLLSFSTVQRSNQYKKGFLEHRFAP